uniref:Uncharacterized protein n=1 Tax=Glossina palpalis gambiensis TaxID=67801 RepID=A0A1B0BCX0_9MUSC
MLFKQSWRHIRSRTDASGSLIRNFLNFRQSAMHDAFSNKGSRIYFEKSVLNFESAAFSSEVNELSGELSSVGNLIRGSSNIREGQGLRWSAYKILSSSASLALVKLVALRLTFPNFATACEEEPRTIRLLSEEGILIKG